MTSSLMNCFKYKDSKDWRNDSGPDVTAAFHLSFILLICLFLPSSFVLLPLHLTDSICCHYAALVSRRRITPPVQPRPSTVFWHWLGSWRSSALHRSVQFSNAVQMITPNNPPGSPSSSSFQNVTKRMFSKTVFQTVEILLSVFGLWLQTKPWRQ